jgi:Tfp pilus assembly protein PilZ
MEKQQRTRRTKRIEVRFGPEQPTDLGFTIDVSETGLFVKTNTVYPPDTRLVLELSLPDRRVLSLRGRVMWAKRVPPQLARLLRKTGMGIELIDPPPEYLDLVRVLSSAAV